MKHRQIKTSFWEDGYTLKLSAIEKTFFLYLFTNPRVNMVGIYELPDVLICPTLGCTLEELELMKQRFEHDQKYYFYDGWVYINNYSRHNTYSPTTNVVNAFIRELTSIPANVINHFLVTKNLSYIPTIDNSYVLKVMVMVKEGSPYPTPYPRIQDVDTKLIADEVDKGLNG